MVSITIAVFCLIRILCPAGFMLMTRFDFDIAICGAGPVGSVVALLLHAQQPALRLAVFDTQAPSPEPDTDPRTLALNYGSQQLLQTLRAWPTSTAPMHTVHVSQQGRLGRTLIQAAELHVPQLGHVALYAQLLHSLHAQLHVQGIPYIRTTQPIQLQSASSHAQILDGNTTYTAALAVQSGGKPQPQLQRHYSQSALLATVAASNPQSGWAYERFTAQGPLALLPHPSHPAHYALVWCNPPERTQHLAQVTPAVFDQQLQHTFGARLGQLRLQGHRTLFPLFLAAGPSLVSPYVVALGNAAQSIHPVAGQGLNLGLRDAAQLAYSLKPWLAQPTLALQPYLAHYVRQRQPDRWLTGSITDLLPRIFATTNPLQQHACGLGLLGMDLWAAVRKPFATQLLQGLRL